MALLDPTAAAPGVCVVGDMASGDVVRVRGTSSRRDGFGRLGGSTDECFSSPCADFSLTTPFVVDGVAVSPFSFIGRLSC